MPADAFCTALRTQTKGRRSVARAVTSHTMRVASTHVCMLEMARPSPMSVAVSNDAKVDRSPTPPKKAGAFLAVILRMDGERMI